MSSSVLDARQRLVDGERVGDVLRSLRAELIAADAAKENRMDAWSGPRNEQEASTAMGC